MDAGHRAIDHTADLAIEVWAPDLGSLITQAARGLIATVLDEHDLQPACRRQISASADEPEVLIHDILTQMLYLIEDDELVPVSVELTHCEGNRAALVVDLVPLEDALPYVSGLIKAVTYHGLEIEQTQTGLQTMIVFDT